MKRRNLLSLIIGTPIAATTITASELTSKTTTASKKLLSDEHLHYWKTLPRFPVMESTDSVTQSMIKSTYDQEPIAFTYHGGSTPGQIRLATIESVFRIDKDSYTYVAAYCHLRSQHRIFRVDRITTVNKL